MLQRASSSQPFTSRASAHGPFEIAGGTLRFEAPAIGLPTHAEAAAHNPLGPTQHPKKEAPAKSHVEVPRVQNLGVFPDILCLPSWTSKVPILAPHPKRQSICVYIYI